MLQAGTSWSRNDVCLLAAAACAAGRCLLDIEPGLTLPLHAHKNLEVAYVLKGNHSCSSSLCNSSVMLCNLYNWQVAVLQCASSMPVNDSTCLQPLTVSATQLS